MSTLKRQKADGTWEYIQVTGEDITEIKNKTNDNSNKIGLLTGLNTAEKSNLVGAVNEIKQEIDKISVETIHVDRYGAVGNGIIDDTLKIQSAIDFVANQGGGTVIFGAKTYLVMGLTLKDNVTLEGRGKNVTTIKLKNGSNSHVIQAGDFDSNADGIKKSTPVGCRTGGLRRLTIDGNKSNQTQKKHGLAYYGIDLQLNEVEFKNASGINLYVESPGDVYSVNVDRNLQSSIRHIECHHGTDGNFLYNGQSDSTMIDIVCYETGGTGLGQFNFKLGNKSSGCRILGIHVWGTSDYGIINEAATAGFTHAHAESAIVAKVWIKASTYFDGRVYQAGAFVEGGANTAPSFLIEAGINNNNIRSTISNCDIAIKFAGSDGGSNLFDIQMYSPNVNATLFSGTLSVSNFVRARRTGGSTESIFQAGTGTMRFGTRTATADVPITGYIEIVDVNGVTRKLAVIG